MNYVLKKSELEEFDLIIVKLTHESFFDFIEDIEKEPLLQDGTGLVLVDQLLSTGNAKNRFVAIPYESGQLLIEQTKPVRPESDYSKEAVSIYRENPSFLDNSILSDEERKKILNE